MAIPMMIPMRIIVTNPATCMRFPIQRPAQLSGRYQYHTLPMPGHNLGDPRTLGLRGLDMNFFSWAGNVVTGAVSGYLTGGVYGAVAGAGIGAFSKTTRFMPNVLKGAAAGGVTAIASGAISSFVSPTIAGGGGVMDTVTGYISAGGSALKSGVLGLVDTPVGSVLTKGYDYVQKAITYGNVLGGKPASAVPAQVYSYGPEVQSIADRAAADAANAGSVGWTWGGVAESTASLAKAGVPAMSAYLGYKSQQEQLAAQEELAKAQMALQQQVPMDSTVPQNVFAGSGFQPTVVPGGYGMANFPTGTIDYSTGAAPGVMPMGNLYDSPAVTGPEIFEDLELGAPPVKAAGILGVPYMYWIIGGAALYFMYTMSTRKRVSTRIRRY